MKRQLGASWELASSRAISRSETEEDKHWKRPDPPLGSLVTSLLKRSRISASRLASLATPGPEGAPPSRRFLARTGSPGWEPPPLTSPVPSSTSAADAPCKGFSLWEPFLLPSAEPPAMSAVDTPRTGFRSWELPSLFPNVPPSTSATRAPRTGAAVNDSERPVNRGLPGGAHSSERGSANSRTRERCREAERETCMFCDHGCIGTSDQGPHFLFPVPRSSHGVKATLEPPPAQVSP